jgi:hypothetical protein
MASHRAKQQRNRRDVQEGLESGNINVCRTMAIRTTLAPYSRHGFTLVSRSSNSGIGIGGVATAGLLALKIRTNLGRFYGSLNGVGGPESQCSQACGRIKIGLAELTYSTPCVGKVKRDVSLQPYCSFRVLRLGFFRSAGMGSQRKLAT